MENSQEAFGASISARRTQKSRCSGFAFGGQLEVRCLLVVAILATAPGICGATGEGVLDGLQLHIEFENNVFDSSPNGYDGQASGDLQYASGVIGQAGSFDGIDDQVLFPAFPDALLGENDFTLAYWFNVPTGSGRSVLGKRVICGLDPFIDIRMNSSASMNLEVASATGNLFISAGATNPGWHHVAFTRTGADFQAFLDGHLVDEDFTPSPIDFSNNAILGLSNSPCVGSADGTQMLKGSIDDLRIYNRVLRQAEIVTLSGIFADDLESGDTSRWALQQPPP